MQIIEKLKQKAQDNWSGAPVTIAFLGDSVTQGCFELYQKNNGAIETVFDKNSAYHNYVARILAILYPSVPVNIINAGVSGGSAPHGLDRLERDVLSHHPDLTVVCFGLNDAFQGEQGLQKYLDALGNIFDKLQAAGSEVLFMTPNMMCTDISCHLSQEAERNMAKNTLPIQNGGILEKYLDGAKELCAQKNVPVCDCYAKWKTLHQGGVEINDLLSNYINHPTREMNWLFAYSLVESMFA